MDSSYLCGRLNELCAKFPSIANRSSIGDDCIQVNMNLTGIVDEKELEKAKESTKAHIKTILTEDGKMSSECADREMIDKKLYKPERITRNLIEQTLIKKTGFVTAAMEKIRPDGTRIWKILVR